MLNHDKALVLVDKQAKGRPPTIESGTNTSTLIHATLSRSDPQFKLLPDLLKLGFLTAVEELP